MTKPPTTTTTITPPRVGTSVFILRHPSTPPTPSPSTPQFLTGRRLGSHGANTHALPGGHLEPGETPEQCATREVLEETGLHIHNVRFMTATNDVFVREGKHYVTLFMVAEQVDPGAEPVTCEPEKCAGWEWMGWGEMREIVDGRDERGREMFLPLVNLLAQRPGVVPGV